jgi:hypothetical protein
VRSPREISHALYKCDCDRGSFHLSIRCARCPSDLSQSLGLSVELRRWSSGLSSTPKLLLWPHGMVILQHTSGLATLFAVGAGSLFYRIEKERKEDAQRSKHGPVHPQYYSRASKEDK